jgi:hypothetical protein
VTAGKMLQNTNIGNDLTMKSRAKRWEIARPQMEFAHVVADRKYLRKAADQG